MAVEVERRLLTVEEFNQIIETGIFHEDERIELINGELIRMAPIGHSHGGQVKRSVRILSGSIGDRALLSVQDPVELPDLSEPQPDVMLLRPRDDDYSRSNPTATDVLLLIEVADTSLTYDRDVKGPMYAEAGIMDYWLLNIVDGQLLVFREPTPTGYASVQALGRGDSVTPLAFPDLTIQVSDLLI
jgi:Uma2 family endonuclease